MVERAPRLAIVRPGWDGPVGHGVAAGVGARLRGRALVEEAGGWALAALAVTLPFELTQRPLLQSRVLVLTNLKLVFIAAAALGALSLLMSVLRLRAGVRDVDTEYLRRLRWVLLSLGALLATSLLSTLAAADRVNALKWTADLIPGGLLALAVPLWLQHDLQRRLGRAAIAFLAGASLAATIGIAEVVLGSDFDRNLLWFKVGPTVVGPYLRLSGTFEYANIAGGYFELAVPVAVAALVWCFSGRWVRKVRALVAAGILLLLGTALVLTASRGAVLGTAVGLAIMALAPRNQRAVREAMRHYRGRAVAMALVILAVAGSGVLLAPALGLRLSSQGDAGWYRVEIQPGRVPALVPGGTAIVPVTVANLSPLAWKSQGNRQFALSYHWLQPDGSVAHFEGARTYLPRVVPSGGKVSVHALVRAPATPGRYVLAWDVVENTVAWFGMRSGSFVETAVRVSGPPAPASPRASAARAEPATLPEAAPQPDRTVLWPAALRMVTAHPLLGVGPDGFRLSYGQYTRPAQRSWDERIFANSLPLELLADLGLLGALSFAALLGIVFSPIARVVWHGSASLWQAALAAAVAAFLSHGLVDYLLGDHAIVIAFWLMIGLGLAVRGSLPTEGPACA